MPLSMVFIVNFRSEVTIKLCLFILVGDLFKVRPQPRRSASGLR